MLPTGLSMISLSAKAWAASENAKLPRFYFDLQAERKSNQKGDTHFSSAVSLIRGLEVALDLMTRPSLARHLKRVHTLALATKAAGDVLGLKQFAQSPSPSLTVFQLPDDVDGQKVRQDLEDKYNITVMGGQERLKGKVLRIGHMGAITDEDCIETMRCLGKILHESYPLICGSSLADKAADAAASVLKAAETSAPEEL